MKIKKIDMEKRKEEFKQEFGYINPLARGILSKQLWKIKCKNCGSTFECAEGSEAYNRELCKDCRGSR